MNFVTVGKNIYPGYAMPLYIAGNRALSGVPERIPMFRLVFAESGSGTFAINGRQILLAAPFLLFLNEADAVGMPPESEISAKTIYFHPSVLNNTFNFENIRDPRHPFSGTEQQDCFLLYPFICRDKVYDFYERIDRFLISSISGLYRDLESELDMQRDFYWPCRSRALFLELLILISKYYEIKRSIPAGFDRKNGNATGEGGQPVIRVCDGIAGCDGASGSAGVSGNNGERAGFCGNVNYFKHISELNAIVSYLQTNYRKRITVCGLAKIFNTNRTTLNERFKSVTGMSLIDYLIAYRINLAMVLLRSTELTISEIQERVGFNNSTHFWRMFKKNTGLSPTGYRKKCL